jgi:HTH-type transcriptional regulator / antitoxin HigA
MTISQIQTEQEYRKALERINELIALDPEEGTPMFQELDTISNLVESYEGLHYPVDGPNTEE